MLNLNLKSMKKILAIAFVLLVTTVNVVSAQANDEYKRTLKKMLDAAGSEATFDSAIKQMLGMFKGQYQSVPENVWAELETEMVKISVNDLVEMLAPVYEKHLSIADLNKIIEFYQTPVGKKYAEKTPFITQESMQVGQEWGMKVGQKFQEKMKEKGY
jgi:uncharacterized protein